MAADSVSLPRHIAGLVCLSAGEPGCENDLGTEIRERACWRSFSRTASTRAGVQSGSADDRQVSRAADTLPWTSRVSAQAAYKFVLSWAHTVVGQRSIKSWKFLV